MRTFLKDFFFFAVFAILMYLILLCGWGEISPKMFRKNLNGEVTFYGYLNKRIQEVKILKNVDVLILGSSQAYRGVDPRILKSFGIKAFNLGSSAQTPLQTELLLKRYLRKLGPKLVVYIVNPGAFSSDGVESSLDLVANDKIDTGLFKLALMQNNVKIYNSMIYKCYKNILSEDSSAYEREASGEDTYIKGGFVQRRMQYFKKVSYETDEWQFNELQFQSFNRILNMLKQKEIDFLIVQAPVTPARYRSYLNNWYFDSTMSAYGPYINFNNELHFDDSLYFYDEQHLNQEGANVFSYKLVEKILNTTNIKR